MSYHREVLYHLSIHSSFMELVFVLRQTDVIQPAWFGESQTGVQGHKLLKTRPPERLG